MLLNTIYILDFVLSAIFALKNSISIESARPREGVMFYAGKIYMGKSIEVFSDVGRI